VLACIIIIRDTKYQVRNGRTMDFVICHQGSVYRRKTTAGSFAKLAEVNVRIMHARVLKLERGLAEERIGGSFDALQNPAS
jgi:hypothetical protein